METINRIPEANGVAQPPKTKRTRKKAATPKKRTTTKKSDGTKAWACFGLIFMATMSALLNGYANSKHAPIDWVGWLMGLAIPIIVLVLGKIAGAKWKKRQHWMAYAAGGSGITLLFLSVYHCATSVAALTGSPLLLALPMAVAIDCGLVACELAIITE